MEGSNTVPDVTNVPIARVSACGVGLAGVHARPPIKRHPC